MIAGIDAGLGCTAFCAGTSQAIVKICKLATLIQKAVFSTAAGHKNDRIFIGQITRHNDRFILRVIA